LIGRRESRRVLECEANVVFAIRVGPGTEEYLHGFEVTTTNCEIEGGPGVRGIGVGADCEQRSNDREIPELDGATQPRHARSVRRIRIGTVFDRIE
jgi:hypothetical protein